MAFGENSRSGNEEGDSGRKGGADHDTDLHRTDINTKRQTAPKELFAEYIELPVKAITRF
jgi:hypothetical protein